MLSTCRTRVTYVLHAFGGWCGGEGLVRFGSVRCVIAELAHHCVAKPDYFLVTGKVTSLVAKKDQLLATQIEEAIRKNQSLEALTADNLRRDIARAKISEQKTKNANLVKNSKQKNKTQVESVKSSSKLVSTQTPGRKTSGVKSGKISPIKSKNTAKISKPTKLPSAGGGSKRVLSKVMKHRDSKRSSPVKSTSPKLSVVGFRGRRLSVKN